MAKSPLDQAIAQASNSKGFPPGFKAYTPYPFAGMNQQDGPLSIADQEFIWNENFIPIGKGALRTAWDIGTPGYGAGTTAGGGATSIPKVLGLFPAPPFPGTGVFIVPNDWNSSNNQIVCIGGGGGGAVNGGIGSWGDAGGGGGGCSVVKNVVLTPGASVTYEIGKGGSGAFGGTAGTGGDTWFNGATFGASTVGAKGGVGGGSTGGGAGGAAASGIGSTKFSGGHGGTGTGSTGAGGGGGAAGPFGNGGAGGGSAGAVGGGGGADGGAAGGPSGTGFGANGGGNGGNASIGGTGIEFSALTNVPGVVQPLGAGGGGADGFAGGAYGGGGGGGVFGGSGCIILVYIPAGGAGGGGNGLTITSFFWYTIGSHPYVALFFSDGSAVQVDVAAAQQLAIAGPGTFYNGANGQLPACQQWGVEYLLISNRNTTNDYWAWDGNILYTAGTAAPNGATLLSGGANYTSPPSLSVYGGRGHGISMKAGVQNGAVVELTITNPGLGYQIGDIVQVAFSGGGSDTSAILQAQLAAGGVSGVLVTSQGSGYTNPTVSFSGGGGTGAAGVVTIGAGSGGVSAVSVTNGGGGYTQASVQFSGGGGTGAAGTVTLGSVSGSVQSITVINGGSGYDANTSVLIATPASGTGATATPVIVNGVIKSITVTNGGSGYTSPPHVLILDIDVSGGGGVGPGGGVTSTSGGSGASATANIGGSVTGIIITNAGTGYTSAPTVTITGDGAGATAVAAIPGNGVGLNITVTNPGSGYTDAPTVTINDPTGTGATAQAFLTASGISGVAVANSGSGFIYAPQLQFVGGGGTGASGIAVLNDTSVASINVVAGGSGYQLEPTLVISGGNQDPGGSTPATGTVDVVEGVVVGVTLTSGGSGYRDQPLCFIKPAAGDTGTGAVCTAYLVPTGINNIFMSNVGKQYTTAPAVEILPGANNAAYATVTLMPYGVSGAAIETFQQRVWIANPAPGPFSTLPPGGNWQVSAPGSFTDFATSDGGVQFTNSDEFLQTEYVQFQQSSGYLYAFGDGSVSVISSVTTSASGTTTLTSFNYQNVDPQIGLAWRDTQQSFGRSLLMANETGVYGLYGGAVTKVSSKMDQFFNSAIFPGGNEIIGGSQKIVAIPSGTTWTVPPDWTGTNTIVCIGAGGGGSFGTTNVYFSAGGGGGACSVISNLQGLTPGQQVTVNVGVGGVGSTTGPTASAGGDTWFNGASLAAASVGAKGGQPGVNGNGGGGGAAGSGVGAIKFSGGSGGQTGNVANGGGGGAAGPSGPGANGGSDNGTTGSGGGGGGGADGGSAGELTSNGAGANGGGGGGGPFQPGGAGMEYQLTGGGLAGSGGGAGLVGGAGGLYGGGGQAGPGANGIIIIVYGSTESGSSAATGVLTPSSAISTIFNIKHYLMLMTVVDPDSGNPRNVMATWNEKDWFITNQSPNLTFIGTQKVGSDYVAWGTDGVNIYPLFQRPSANLQKRLDTKLFGGDQPLILKQFTGAWMSAQDHDGSGISTITQFNVSGWATITTPATPSIPMQSTPDLPAVVSTLNFQFHFFAPYPSWPVLGIGSNEGTPFFSIGAKIFTNSVDFTLGHFVLGYQDLMSAYLG